MKTNRRTVVRGRSSLILFLALAAGLCAGAVASLAAAGLPIR